MRLSTHPSGGFRYVHVQVGSRVYALPVEPGGSPASGVKMARRLTRLLRGRRATCALSSIATHPTRLWRETIERGSAEAARHISRKLLQLAN